MTSIADVQEGKSNYFTLEEIDGVEVVFVEDIDTTKPLRSHKVEGKGEGKKKEAEYFDFAVQHEGIVKDIGLTYTGLRQLSEVIPKDLKNWQGIRIKYSGTKGAGKNIKYKWEYLGIAAKGTYQTQQTTIPTSKQSDVGMEQPTDASGQLLRVLSCSTAGISDVEFWKHVEHLTGGNLSGGMALVQHLKEQGRLFQDKDGFWKVGK